MSSELESCINYNNKTTINGYELSNLLIRNGKKLELKPSELLVFIALASYYNGKPVFPKITTLSINTNLSDKAIRTALNTLIERGYLIKSKRGKNTNSNIYNINVKAVLNTVQSGKFYHAKAVNFTASYNEQTIITNHEKQQQEKEKKIEQKNVVVLSSLSPKYRIIKLTEVPEIIKSNKNIKNPCAYWASLSKEAKNEYLQKQTLEKVIAKKREEAKQKADLELMKRKKEIEEAKKQAQKPLKERFTRENAIRHITMLPDFLREKSKLAKELIEIYNLTDELCKKNEIHTKTIHTIPKSSEQRS